jgi:hypothetical protein
LIGGTSPVRQLNRSIAAHAEQVSDVVLLAVHAAERVAPHDADE